MNQTAQVSARAKQAEFTPTQWDWVDRTIWTERMLAALGNGVKGNKWSQTLAKCVLRSARAIHHDRSQNVSEPIPMRKPLTGEPRQISSLVPPPTNLHWSPGFAQRNPGTPMGYVNQCGTLRNSTQ